MKKLEQYLDQVCQTIGGPAELRDHVRQELREHLLDAVAQHQAAGMSEAQAVDKALEEFGSVDDVRAELEAAHGRRMTWILDKAMQWKEKTMKAKWLWMTWAHLGVVGVIALEVLFITFNVLMILPKFQKLRSDGIIDLREDDGIQWMLDFLNNLQYVCGHYATFMLLGAVVAVGLFEWRVKGENKAFIRLSVLGMLAVALMVIVMIMSGALVIAFCLGAPPMSRMARPWAVEQVTTIDASMSAVEESLKKKDWKTMSANVERASSSLTDLSLGPALPSLASRNEAPLLHELRNHRQAASENLQLVRQAIVAEDAERLRGALAEFRKSFEPLREAAKKPAK